MGKNCREWTCKSREEKKEKEIFYREPLNRTKRMKLSTRSEYQNVPEWENEWPKMIVDRIFQARFRFLLISSQANDEWEGERKSNDQIEVIVADDGPSLDPFKWIPSAFSICQIPASDRFSVVDIFVRFPPFRKKEEK